MAFVKELAMIALIGCITNVKGHGFLADPPARNTMWREGFPNPINYNDMGLNCGGLSNQFDVNNGKCGVCGDPYQGPRKHEAGYPGGYANGMVVRHYKMGDVIQVEAKITANHLGHVAFKLCPVNDKNKRVTQECLDKYPLRDVNGNREISVYNQLGNNPGLVRASLVLPKQLTCTQCVIQWYYTSGNNYGGPGTAQESFVNCADVMISQNGGPQPTPPPPTFDRKPSYKTDRDGKPIPGQLWDCNLISPFDIGDQLQNNYNWCMDNCITIIPQQRRCNSDMCRCYIVDGMTTYPETTTPRGGKTTTQQPTTAGPGGKRNPDEWTCKLVSPYDVGSATKLQSLTEWCVDNCVKAAPRHRNCPANVCTCEKDTTRTTTPKPTTRPPPPGPRDPSKWTCDVVSPYDRANTANSIRRWCMNNCVLTPESQRFCPASHCDCYYTGQNGRQRITTSRPQGFGSNSINGRQVFLNAQGYCTLVNDWDESASNSAAQRRWCADTCIPQRRSRRNRCNTSKCSCSRF